MEKTYQEIVLFHTARTLLVHVLIFLCAYINNLFIFELCSNYLLCFSNHLLRCSSCYTFRELLTKEKKEEIVFSVVVVMIL